MPRFLTWLLAALAALGLILAAGYFLGFSPQNAALVAPDAPTPPAMAPEESAAAVEAAEAAAPSELSPSLDDATAAASRSAEFSTQSGAFSRSSEIPQTDAGAEAAQTAALRDCAIHNLWGAPGCPTLSELVDMFSGSGEIAFTSIPSRMRFRQSYTVHAAATRAAPDSQLAVGAAEAQVAGAAPGAEIDVATAALLPALEMELTGEGFEITPLQSRSAQTLRDNVAAEWSWRVRPISGGAHDLSLTAWGVLGFGEGIEPVRVRTIHHTVTVEIGVQDRLAVGGEYLLSNWEALAGLIGGVGAAGGGMWGAWRFLRRRRRRKS